MKKIIMAASAALLTLSVVGCKDVVDKSAERANMSFEDSVACYSGELMGAMFRQHIDNPASEVEFDKAEIIRGIRDVMKTDTANVSYIVGLQMGMSAFQTYQAMAKDVDGISRADYVAAIMHELNVDSLGSVEQLRATFMGLQREVEARKQLRLEEEAYNSEEAQSNRKIQEAMFATLKNEGKCQELSDGIFCEVITAGKGTKLAKGDAVMVEFQVDNANGEKSFGNIGNPRQMKVGRASMDLLDKLLPYMEMGETAKFYVPWEQAWGKAGLPQSGIGPCQAVMVTLTTNPVSAK